MDSDKSLDSAETLVAIGAAHCSHLPEVSFSTAEYHARPCRTVEDTGVDKDDYEQVVDSKCVGRQTFLLDEPLRQVDDRQLFWLPLDDIKCQSNSREESIPWNALDDGLPIACGWGPPEWRDFKDWPEPRARQVAWLELIPISRSTAKENVRAMNMSVAALQEQSLMGEPEALLEEMYRKYINEAQCQENGVEDK